MKVLSKKLKNVKETIEAYCVCNSCYCSCTCSCGGTTTASSYLSNYTSPMNTNSSKNFATNIYK